MSMLSVSSASISEGPALKTRAVTFAGATALAKSPDATPSTACACVTFPKYPIRTSPGGADGGADEPVRSHPKAKIKSSRADQRMLTNDKHFQRIVKFPIGK